MDFDELELLVGLADVGVAVARSFRIPLRHAVKGIMRCNQGRIGGVLLAALAGGADPQHVRLIAKYKGFEVLRLDTNCIELQAVVEQGLAV